MIGKLKGLLDTVEDDHAIVDVQGVGYNVALSARSLKSLPPVGEGVVLIIETQVREDAIKLIGFTDTLERDWFRLLLSVQGVGTRVALALLGTLSPADLSQAIAFDDRKRISAAPGIGPRMAARIAAELKDKIAALPTGASEPALSDGSRLLSQASAVDDAVSALVNLGYPENRARLAVAKVAGEIETDAENVSAEQLIRLGLKELAR